MLKVIRDGECKNGNLFISGRRRNFLHTENSLLIVVKHLCSKMCLHSLLEGRCPERLVLVP